MQPWHWFVLGLILTVAEIFTMTFAALWFGIAAIIVSALLWLFPNAMPDWQTQALVWLILSVVSAISWFKLIEPKWRHKKITSALGSGASSIIGETGMIVKPPIADQAGTVRFRVPKVGATEWQCRSESDTIKMGDRVIVTNIIGNELMVKTLNSTNNA